MMYRIFVTLLIILAMHLTAVAQSKVEIPALSATIEEIHRWVANTMSKYGSYKTRTTSVKVTAVSAGGCRLAYTATRQDKIELQDQLGVKSRINSIKDEVRLDLAEVESGGITLEPHIHAELQTVAVTTGKAANKRVTEFVVKSEAGDPLVKVLERITAPCRPKP